MVVDGHKMLPIAGCSLGGGKYLSCSSHGHRHRLVSSHAEINALKELSHDLLHNRKKASKLVMVVIRLNASKLLEFFQNSSSDGDHSAESKSSAGAAYEMLDSKPCYDCLLIMQSFGIEKLLYSCSGNKSLTKGRVSQLLLSKDFVVSKGGRTYQ